MEGSEGAAAGGNPDGNQDNVAGRVASRGSGWKVDLGAIPEETGGGDSGRVEGAGLQLVQPARVLAASVRELVRRSERRSARAVRNGPGRGTQITGCQHEDDTKPINHQAGMVWQ